MNITVSDFSGAIKDLYERFGLWCLALIALTFGIMIGVNYLLKWLFRNTDKEQLIALRKFLSSCAVFVVAIGVLYLFNIVIDNEDGMYCFAYALSNAITIASASMVIWALTKAVWRIGLKGGIAAIIKKFNSEFKILYNSIPLDKTVKKIVYDQIEEFVTKNAEGLEIDKYIDQNELEIFQKTQNLLLGFVENENVEKFTKQFIETLKLKHKGD